LLQQAERLRDPQRGFGRQVEQRPPFRRYLVEQAGKLLAWESRLALPRSSLVEAREHIFPCGPVFAPQASLAC
jgi:hypothetical protein